MPNMVPLYEIMRGRGYAPSRGQMIALGRALNTMYKYRTEKLYDHERRTSLAYVDTLVITKHKMDEVVRSMKVLDRIVPPVPPRPTPPKLPPAPVEVQPPDLRIIDRKDVHSIVDILLNTLRAYVAPYDATAALERISHEMDTISLNLGMTLGVVEKRMAELSKAAPAQADPRRLLPPLPSMEHTADYIEHVAAVVPEKLVQYMELAERIRAAAKPVATMNKQEQAAWDYELPLDAVWKGEHWVHLVYADTFIDDWTALREAKHEKAIRSMLAKLTQNPHHKGLNTHKRKFKESNPPGVHPDAVYSRASDNVRVYWLQTGEDTVEFQRIIVKAG